MAWVRLDDQFPDNPKVIRAGPLAELLHVRAICYAMRHLTDGFIPAEVVPSLYVGINKITKTPLETTIKILLRVGLWHRSRQNGAKAGYDLHDFLKYNPSKKQVEEARLNKAAAGRLGALSRWGGQETEIRNDGRAHNRRMAEPMADA